MTFENLLLHHAGGVMTITINRPDKLNALNKKTITELDQAFTQVMNDASVKAVIITGAGNKAFVAGADISEFSGFSQGEGVKFSEYGQKVFKKIEDCPKPVIAAVNGFALGGGCELAMACHLRVAADQAKFGQPEVKLGLIPGYGGTQRLIQYIGKSKAAELLMTADMMDAAEAHRLGLVNYVTTPDQLLPKSMEILGKIMAQSPMAIKGIIRTVNAYYEPVTDGFKAEVEEFGKCCVTEDFREGTKAFLEKRKPLFPGK